MSLIERQAAVDTEISGVPIPKGTLVNVDVLGMHYNENLWKDPYKFDPERFSVGGELESHPCTYSYVPFGGGARQCIGKYNFFNLFKVVRALTDKLTTTGMNFSLAEQRVALSAILRKYELSLPENSIHKNGLKFSGQLFVLSAENMKINFTKRY